MYENYEEMSVNNGIDKLHALSLEELYDEAYKPKMPIIEDFLYAGTYLFVGAPKVGKSFFMAQLGYHISMGKLYDYSHDREVFILSKGRNRKIRKRIS